MFYATYFITGTCQIGGAWNVQCVYMRNNKLYVANVAKLKLLDKGTKQRITFMSRIQYR